MDETVRMVSQDRGRRRRVWILSGALVVLVAVVLLLTLGRSAVMDYAQEEVVSRARANGIILHLTTTEVSSSKVRLGRANVELEGVKGVYATFESAEITLERLTATRIVVDGLAIQAVGEPLMLVRAISDWHTKYTKPNEPTVLPTPELRKTKFTWSPADQLSPFVSVDEIAYSQNTASRVGSRSFVITGSRAQVGAYVLQPLTLALRTEPDAIEVGFGTTQIDTAAVRGGWRHVPGADDFHVSFTALPIAGLLEHMNLSSKDPRLAAASCGGTLSLRVPEDPKLAYGGQFSLDLVGWTPPHPPELDGFPFGDTTKLESALAIDRALSQVRLEGLKLTAGGFKLAGQGQVELEALSYARINAELKGQLACSTVASSMAESRLGKAYGRWVAKNAHRAVAGHVDVSVRFEADTRRMDQARVFKRIGVGCGLRPLTLREALSLGLPPPPDADLLRRLPKLDVKLPELPKLPPLPSIRLPDFDRKRE